MNLSEEAEQYFVKGVEISPDLQLAYSNVIAYYSVVKPNHEKALYYAQLMQKNGVQLIPEAQQLLQSK